LKSEFIYVILKIHSELIGFWTLSIVQYSKNSKIREHNVWKTGSVSVLRSGGRGWFLVPYKELTSRLDPVFETFSLILEFLVYWTMDKVQKPINSECYTPSSEPIRIYLKFSFASQETHDVSILKTSRLILLVFREIIAVYSENHMKHANTLCGQNAEVSFVTASGIYRNYWALNG
jgi:hypothetical protein